ncbi:MAG: S8/S53 family peptidase [Anaerolineae bacterium]|jgi:hypothetical protein
MDARQLSYVEKEQPANTERRLWALLALLILFLILLILLLLSLGPGRESRYYVEDEFLVTGPQAEIEDAIAKLREELRAGVTISPIGVPLTLAFPISIPVGCPGLPPALVEGQEYVISRYRISGPADVPDILERLQEITGGGPVQPEPNYLTGRPPETTQADPWSIGGSPWSIGGSPWSIGASPWCVGGSPWSIGGSPWSIGGSPAGSALLAKGQADFRDQWAFDEEGINLRAATRGSLSGQGVLVGIFDTSPFPPTFSHVVIDHLSPLDVGEDRPSFELDLYHPIAGGLHGNPCEVADARDHGLYAAGLVHAVAPDSEIRLIRVLDDAGQGDLQTLNRALLDFITEVVARKGAGEDRVQQAVQGEPLAGAVINLSLGVHPPPGTVDREQPEEIASLSTILSVAQCFNLVTVAAAGNDSALSDEPLPAQIPAAWSSAIGVAASNKEGQISCFSNEGQIMAPGGDGGPRRSDCRPMLHTCEDGECPYGLISLSLLSPTGYIYWHGTSFSAPLVSGWAAVLVQRGKGELTQDQVLQEMQASDRPGAEPNLMTIDVSGSSP